ncbi:MAG TPA: nuclear transport factor 2 family protein [Myxococcaceae bacterium]|jgi:ketosteroid isomerase-like protein
MRHLSGAALVLFMSLGGTRPEPSVPKEIQSVLDEYRGAMEARSVERLSKVVAPELVVVEGTGINVGWPDYRDHHIGPELQEMRSFRYLELRVIDAAVSGGSAHVVVQERLEIVEEKETVVLAAVESFVLRKTAQGWRLRLIHFSGKRVPAPAADAGAPR